MTTGTAGRDMASTWWLILLQGIAILILSFFLLTSPIETVFTLVVFMGVYWLVDGIFSIIKIFTGSSDTHWGWLLASGILGILAGFLVVRHPLWATILIPTTLVLVLGINGIIIGGIGLFRGFKGGGIGAIILGIINIIFGLLLVANPVLGATVLPWILGIFGLFGGIALIFFSFKVKNM